MRGVGEGNKFIYRGVLSQFNCVSRVIDEHWYLYNIDVLRGGGGGKFN